jgi:rubrerythrin
LNDIIRFMGEGSPYLSRAGAEIRRPLLEMVATNERHGAELYALIEHLGGEPRTRGVEPEEQYLAFLSLKFLLPKLVDAKRLTIRRYENAIKSIGKGPDDVNAVLESHVADLRAELQVLEHTAKQVAGGKVT